MHPNIYPTTLTSSWSMCSVRSMRITAAATAGEAVSAKGGRECSDQSETAPPTSTAAEVEAFSCSLRSAYSRDTARACGGAIVGEHLV